MKDFLKKLGSRKFLMALISVISGVMSMMNCGDSLIQFVCSLILIIVPTIVYIITEGVLDYTGIGLALEQIIEVLQKYIDSKKEATNENQEKFEEELLQEDKTEIAKDEMILD